MVPDIGQPQKCRLNTAKIGFPMRANSKLDVARVVCDLEIDEESKQPFKPMRYPIDDGQRHQKLLGIRSNWFVQKLGFSREDANEWANLEFMAFYGTEQNLVYMNDPGNTISKLIARGLDPVLILEAKKDTKVSDSILLQKYGNMKVYAIVHVIRTYTVKGF